MSYSIFHSFTIKAEKSEVFKAVSDPNHLINWWPLKCSGNPKVGELYNFNFTDKYDWYSKVERCKENESIHFKMTESDDDWNPTTFGFDLATTNDGTKLEFSHVNWPECNAHFKHSSFCWALLLNGLKNYLEKGIIIPFEERA
ncbi:MAG: hypothetical protein CMC76_09495 [Flavobacteriaceae bacterium]|nr:hypothetical protein [Flavobacteriaceae bacterium]|tara:strand:- start:1138 stop:1566 length:429 start_codon:yes stop_codon:yes gene_type:complete